MKRDLVDATVKQKVAKQPAIDLSKQVFIDFSGEDIKIIEESPGNLQDNKVFESGDIDIEKLVEICYQEEKNTVDLVKGNPTSATVLPFKKRRTDHYNEVPLKICNQPLMPFTFEEEYRLHDLIVRREYFNEKTAEHMLAMEPEKMQNAQEKMFADMRTNRKITFDEEYLDFFFNASKKIASKILPEVFDEFSHLKHNNVSKCIEHSFPATLPLMWACLEAKKDESLLEQDKFLGYNHSNPTIALLMEKAEKVLADIQTSKGTGMEDYSHFISPWAQTWEEEVFFETSVKTLIQLLRGDMKTSLLFQLVILASNSFGSLNIDNGIKGVQAELGTFLYRYLVSKQEGEDAAEQVHSLMGMVGKLHRCGHILTNRRIRMLSADQ